MDIVRIITESYFANNEENESPIQKRTIDEAMLSGLKNLNPIEITWKEFSDKLKLAK